jgi:hypothetical protein
VGESEFRSTVACVLLKRKWTIDVNWNYQQDKLNLNWMIFGYTH